MRTIALGLLVALSAVASCQSQFAVSVERSGKYSVSTSDGKWTLSGNIGQSISPSNPTNGVDSIGSYTQVTFAWDQGDPVTASIRTYAGVPVVWFRLHYAKAQAGHGISFPNFTTFPGGLHQYGFRDGAFAPPTFGLPETSTPWLLFDDSARSLIISPASGFLVAKMTGDGVAAIGSGLNVRLSSVPAGYDQDCLLAYGDGIGATWASWGSALRSLYHRPAARYDSDVLLKKFGYWTDNGAGYYYNYDQQLGYAGTLVALKKRYDEEHIPIAYLQLDSWWYPKTVNGPAGKPGGATKNSKLPAQSWNRYGGLLEYRASPDLFPRGLPVFRAQVGVPLAVHNRWIDRTSPYASEYKVSGVGAVDPRFWGSVAVYLKGSGIVTYEQDWLSSIYANSPEMATTVGVGDAFAEGMAKACAAQGLTMQYCMATPRFFLEGVKFPNLTTIRTSDDRFEPRKWANFLRVSQLATAVGIAPWCDVFKSGELGNMTLAVLSCGPVGTGDAMGKENVANIHKAARLDGVIVKPDSPLLPCDRTYLDEAHGGQSPFLATTATDQGVRTQYLFAFPGKSAGSAATFKPADFGFKTKCYVFNLVSLTGRFVGSDEAVPIAIGGDGYAYCMLAPVTNSGVVLLGDLGKLVPTGRQRIADVSDGADALSLTVAFGVGESAVTISGVCARRPVIKATEGSADAVRYDAATGRFDVDVHPSPDGAEARLSISQ